MHDFFAPNVNIPPELAIANLSSGHLFYLFVWAVFTPVLCLAMRRHSHAVKWRCLKILIFTILVSEAVRVIWGIYNGLFTVQDWLPLHLCSMIVFFGPVMVYTRNEKLRNILISFTYGVSMPAAFFAVLTPDKPVLSAFTFAFCQTMYTHGAIVCIGVYLIAAIGYRPRFKELPKLFGMLLCLLALCFVVNRLINWLDPKEIPYQANYMFLTFAPRDTLLETFESFSGRYYMIPTVILLLLMWIVLFIPWEIYYRINLKKCPRRDS